MARSKSIAVCVIVASLLCIPLIVQVKAATVIFSENFEGAFPGSWTVGDAKPASGLDYWDDVSVKYRSGLWSGYCAGIGTHYVNTTVWSENFEGTFPTSDYNIWDYTAESGLDMWDDTNYKAHGGSWSAWCAQNGTQLVGVDYIANFDLHRYDTNMEARLLRWADLSSYDYATLSYWYWKNCDVGDYFWSAYHTSNQTGGENTYVNHGGGDSGGWQHWEVTLPSNCVWVAFGFSSSALGNNAEGAYVDDIIVTGVKETTNLNLTPQYDNNMDAYMYRTVDLSGYSFVMLSYWYWISSEPTYDFLQASYHTSSGWTYTNTQSGYSNGWTNIAVNLTSAVDMVGFRFYSDDSISNFEGAFLDDVILVGYNTPTGSITINGGASFTSSRSVTLSLNYQAYGTTVSQLRYSNDSTSWTAWEAPTLTKSCSLTPGDGQKTVYFQIKDAEDLVSSAISDTIALDTTSPTGTISINGGDAYAPSATVTLSLTANDAGSGVSQARFSNDGTSWTAWESYSNTKSWALAPGDGSKTVHCQLKDNAGFISSTFSDSILLDTAPPTGSISINSGNSDTGTTGVMLSLSYSDAGSGVSQVRYSNDGVWDTEPWESPAASRGWSLSAGDGTKTVYFQVKDSAGLTSSTSSDTIILDTSPPQGSIQINSGATYTNATTVTLALLATDAGSGVWGMHFSNDGATWTGWEPYATTKTWSLEGGPGEKQVNVQFIDNVDLTVWAWDTITLDTMLPVANAGQNQNVQVEQVVTFNGGASADNTGIASYLWNFGDGTTGTGAMPTHAYSSEGTFTVTLMVKDLAGNSAASSATVTVEVIIPEFPPALMLAALMIATLAISLAFKRKTKP